MGLSDHGLLFQRLLRSLVKSNFHQSFSRKDSIIIGIFFGGFSLKVMEEEKEVAVIPSTEDVVQALLDYFVEPVLPPKRFFEAPPLDQQLSVAKQVTFILPFSEFSF